MNNKLDDIKVKIFALLSEIERMETANEMVNIRTYQQFCMGAVCKSEQIACLLRQFVYAVGGITHENVMRQAIKEQDIQLQKTDVFCEIELPGLLPKKGNERNSRFLIDPLFFYLYEYCKNNEVTKFIDCVVCFMHIYNQSLPATRIHDYDNMELKQILDVIATFFLLDDSGSKCDMYHTTCFGEKDCTKVFIMDKKVFPDWLLKQDKVLLLG